MNFRSTARVAILCAAFGPAASHALAQVVVQQMRNDIPTIRRLDSPAVRPGTTVELILTGDRLDGLKKILSSAKIELLKIEKAKGKSAKILISVASDAKPGVYSFHVLCNAGLSNPRLLRIDRLPISKEKEPNNRLDKATALEIPCGVSGVLPANDIDCYSFAAKSGQQLVFDLEAHRLGSAIRGVLVIADASGRELRRAWLPNSTSQDVRLVHRFEDDGKFYVRVTERLYQGTPNRTCYLRVGELSCAKSMFPLGGRRGTKVKLRLEGGSLAQPLDHEINIDKSFPWNRQQLLISTSKGLVCAPHLFAIADLPEANEQEPNNDLKSGQVLTLPVVANGRIGRPGDRDFFRFKASAGQRLNLRVIARELGSPLDPVLTIRNAKGRVLSRVDDFNNADRIPPLVRASNTPQNSDDVRFLFRVPQAGEYSLAVSDRFRHSGPEFGYRLQINATPADFELMVQPGQVIAQQKKTRRRKPAVRTLALFDGQGTGVLSIDRGGQGTLVVKVARHGYAGAIKIVAKNVPKGMTVQDLVIPAGQKQGLLRFLAGFDATMNAGLVEIVGLATINNRQVVRRAEHPVVFSAMPLGVVAEKTLQTVAVGISNRGAELAMRAEMLGPLVPGGKTRLRFEIRRRKGINGPVAIKALAIPTGIIVPAISIPAKVNIKVVEVRAGLKTSPGKRFLQFQAEIKVKKRKQPLTAVTSVAIELRSVITLTMNKKRLDIQRGKTVTLVINAQSLKLARGSVIEFKASRLPRGVTVAPLKISANAKSSQIKIIAAKNARVSPIRRIVQLRPTLRIGKDKIPLPSLRFALRVQR